MWLSQLAYLADIFCILMGLIRAYRVSILHHSQSVMKQKHSEKYLGFRIKVESGQVSFFPFLDSFISENEIQLNPELVVNIKEH
jgi:hypothetical protein